MINKDKMNFICFYVIILIFVTETQTNDRVDIQINGIPDATATVGQLFRHAIPSDILNQFHGNDLCFKVTEAGESSLPLWVIFNKKDREFQGVPLDADVGRVYISVKVFAGASTKTHCTDKNSTMIADIFSIEVEEASPRLCSSGEQETFVSITFNLPTPWSLQPIDRIRILTEATAILKIHESRLHFITGREKSMHLIITMGCSTENDNEQNTLLFLIESNKKILQDLLGFSLIDIKIERKNMKPQKRHVPPLLGTPLPSLKPTKWPTTTYEVDGDIAIIVPDIHNVPMPSSPLYFSHTSDVQHRHRHGDFEVSELHRFNLRKSETIYDIQVTPTLHRFPTSSLWKFHGTPMPTPVVYPEKPTKAITVAEGTFPLWITTPYLPATIVGPHFTPPTAELPSADLDLLMTRTGFALPEPTARQVPNFRPALRSRLKELSVVAGKAWRYVIPRDTFADLEDGDTRALKLIFTTAEGASIPPTSWIQFDPERQALYALPLRDDEGEHEFSLEAMDRDGATAVDRVRLRVWPHPVANNFHHIFALSLRYSKWQYPVGVDWQIEILQRLALLFGDRDVSKFAVVNVTSEPARISWINDSLVQTSKQCPLEDIKSLYDTLAEPGGLPTRALRRLLAPEFRALDVTLKWRGMCEGAIPSSAPPPNFEPKLRRPLGRFEITVGDVFWKHVPDDAFYDFEDGGTRHLQLTLLSIDGQEPPASSWLRFDPHRQELFGVAQEEDIGQTEWRLTATDSEGLTTYDTFELKVRSRPLRRSKYPIEFSIRLETDFANFVGDATNRALVALKLANLYGDSSPHYLDILSIQSGSVRFSWSNKTLLKERCPVDTIKHLLSYLLQDGKLTSKLIRTMKPQFQVIGAEVVPKEVCHIGAVPTFVSLTEKPSMESSTVTGPPTVKTLPTSGDDILITTLLPAALLAIVLIIAGGVVWLLRGRALRKGLGIDDDIARPGVPVVFAGELEELRPDPGKTPAVLTEERPPLSSALLGPFRRSTTNEPPQAAHVSRTDEQRSRRILREMPSYQPPPPFIREPPSKAGRIPTKEGAIRWHHNAYT